MNVRELLGKRMLFFDGGMGSMLQKNGMGAGEIPELLNLTNAALIEKYIPNILKRVQTS